MSSASSASVGNAAVSSRTRAEVIAELQQARAKGELLVGESYATTSQAVRHL